MDLGIGISNAPHATVMTNAAGLASTTWTRGATVGVQTMSAVVAWIPPVFFNANATQIIKANPKASDD